MFAYFHGWRRKMGAAPLVMAYAFMLAWLRSGHIDEAIAFGFGSGTHVFVSDNGSISWFPLWRDERIPCYTRGIERDGDIYLLLTGLSPPQPRALGIGVKKDLSIKEGARLIVDFTSDEITLDHGIAHRIEFREKRCNLTLKNTTGVRKGVNVRVFVLNAALIEIWKQSEKWSLASLQPDQVHAVSWTFAPELPDVVWNEKARLIEPRWIVVDAL